VEELIPIALFVSAAAVAILRPLTTRVGKLLEAMARERTAALRPPSDDPDSARLRSVIEHLGRRLDLMEERLDFTERLLSSGRPGFSASPTLRTDAFRPVRETDLLSG
jgi:hypothetical protein